MDTSNKFITRYLNSWSIDELETIDDYWHNFFDGLYLIYLT